MRRLHVSWGPRRAGHARLRGRAAGCTGWLFGMTTGLLDWDDRGCGNVLKTDRALERQNILRRIVVVASATGWVNCGDC